MATFMSSTASSDNNCQQDIIVTPEVCEPLLRDSGPFADLYACFGEAHARRGNIAEAARAYSNALKFGRDLIHIDKSLHSFAIALIDVARSKPKFLEIMAMTDNTGPMLFTCRICLSLWVDPITLGCGHTFCRHCMERDALRECPVCRYPVTKERLAVLKTSFLLAQTTEKWFPKEYAFCERKRVANRLMAKRRFAEALEAYSQAVELVPSDMELRNCRANAFVAVGNFSSALDDADIIIANRPNWAQGYQRRAEALTGLERPEEAMSAYIQCLSIEPNCPSAFSDFTKILRTVLSPVSADDPEVRKVLDIRDNLSDSTTTHLLSSIPTNLSPDILNFTTHSSCTFAGNLGESCLKQTNSADEHCINSGQECERMSKNPACALSAATDACVPTTSTSTSSFSLETSRISGRTVPIELLNIDDFECTLCSRMLFHPVMTCCGHVFCCECLYRSLDYRSDCPLCKESLAEYLAERPTTTVEALEQIFDVYFHKELELRARRHAEELEEAARNLLMDNQEVPIFVCTMAFPMVPCPLHVFEPRYRLMIRRCMEAGTRQFGMCICLDNNEENFASYGTMLEIRDVQYYADGRALVDAVGGRRFHVLSRGQKDGYRTARVEFLHDQQVPAGVEDVSDNDADLFADVYQEAHSWFSSLRNDVKARILQHYGEFPPPSLADEHNNGPAWMWYTTSILPLDPQIQLTILAITSPRDRLTVLRRWIERVRTSFVTT